MHGAANKSCSLLSSYIVFLTTAHSALQHHNQWDVSSRVKTLHQVLLIFKTFLQSSLNQLQSHGMFNNHSLELC